MSHNTLTNYYNIVYQMVHQFQFASLSEIENMIPFELDVYSSIITSESQKHQDQMKMESSLQRNML